MARLRDRAQVFGANLRKRDEVLFDLPAQAAQVDHSVMSAIETCRHLGARRARRALRELRPHARRLQLLPQPTLPKVAWRLLAESREWRFGSPGARWCRGGREAISA